MNWWAEALNRNPIRSFLISNLYKMVTNVFVYKTNLNHRYLVHHYTFSSDSKHRIHTILHTYLLHSYLIHPPVDTWNKWCLHSMAGANYYNLNKGCDLSKWGRECKYSCRDVPQIGGVHKCHWMAYNSPQPSYAHTFNGAHANQLTFYACKTNANLIISEKVPILVCHGNTWKWKTCTSQLNVVVLVLILHIYAIHKHIMYT